MPRSSRISLVGILGFLFIASPATAACRWEQTLLPYQVCTDWWDGSRSCHYQFGWFDVYTCDRYGGGGGLPPGGGGTIPPSDPPPELQILSISDENTNQLVLSLYENSAVVETTVAHNGNTFMTTGRTNHLFLGPLDAYDSGSIISVQARNASNVYATAIMHIYKNLEGTSNRDSVYAVYTVIDMGGEPEQDALEWERVVELGYTKTTYDIATYGARNGLFKHELVEDQLGTYETDVAMPAWETIYRINNPQLANHYYGWRCSLWDKDAGFYRNSSICTDVAAYVRDYDTSGLADIVDMDIPFQTTFVTIFRGGAVLVTPY